MKVKYIVGCVGGQREIVSDEMEEGNDWKEIAREKFEKVLWGLGRVTDSSTLQTKLPSESHCYLKCINASTFALFPRNLVVVRFL